MHFQEKRIRAEINFLIKHQRSADRPWLVIGELRRIHDIVNRNYLIEHIWYARKKMKPLYKSKMIILMLERFAQCSRSRSSKQQSSSLTCCGIVPSSFFDLPTQPYTLGNTACIVSAKPPPYKVHFLTAGDRTVRSSAVFSFLPFISLS